jgi:hypothetical protein
MAAFFSAELPRGTTIVAAIPARRAANASDAAAHLERADRRVILMLDEDIRADAGREARPRVLGRRRHGGSHDRQCGFNLGEGEQGASHRVFR